MTYTIDFNRIFDTIDSLLAWEKTHHVRLPRNNIVIPPLEIKPLVKDVTVWSDNYWTIDGLPPYMYIKWVYNEECYGGRAFRYCINYAGKPGQKTYYSGEETNNMSLIDMLTLASKKS